MINFSFLVRKVVQYVPLDETQFVEIKIGLHIGDAVGGISGKLTPRYCFFGETINIAGKIESAGLTNRIHVSSEFASFVKHIPGSELYVFEKREDVVDIKGKGQLTTYWLEHDPDYDVEKVHFDTIQSLQALVDNFSFVKPELLSLIPGAAKLDDSKSWKRIPSSEKIGFERITSSGSIDTTISTTHTLNKLTTPVITFNEISKLDFDIISIPMDDTFGISANISMIFEVMFDLNSTTNSINVDKRVVSNFVRRVSRSYRKVPYHNYYHAFCVVQFTTALLVQCDLVKELPSRELFCLLVCATPLK